MDPLLFWCLIIMACCMILGTLVDSFALWGIAVGLAFWSCILYLVIPM